MRNTLIILAIALGAGGCQQTRGLYDIMSGNTPLKNAAYMQSDNADQRWRGIHYLVDREYGQRPPYTTRYAQIAKDDPDPFVRAVAVRALHRSGDASGGPVFTSALSDENEWVRLEGARGLAVVPDQDAVPQLVGIIGDKEQPADIRIAAAAALRHYASIEAARSLIAQLSERDFGLAWQCRQSLVDLTGHDFRYDQAAWLRHLTKPQPFVS